MLINSTLVKSHAMWLCSKYNDGKKWGWVAAMLTVPFLCFRCAKFIWNELWCRVLWDFKFKVLAGKTPCNLVHWYKYFGGPCYSIFKIWQSSFMSKKDVQDSQKLHISLSHRVRESCNIVFLTVIYKGKFSETSMIYLDWQARQSLDLQIQNSWHEGTKENESQINNVTVPIIPYTLQFRR
jgi:hypothetical protein